MAFFHNRNVNLVNLHSAITAAALGSGGAFWLVYLLKAGVSVPGVLLAAACTFLMRLLLRSFLMPVAIRTGVRVSLILGTLLMAISFPFLVGVHGVGQGLYIMLFVTALADTVYWPSYHAYYASMGDEEHRGQQLGLREAVSAVLGIVAPLAAGWVLVIYGPRATFFATAAIQAAAAIPLLWTPDVPVQRRVPGAFRYALSGAMIFIGDGWVAAGYSVTWQIALFLTLHQSYLAYGGALAIASLVGAVSGLALGRFIDSGNGARAVWYAIALIMAVIVMRANSGHNPALAIAANAMGSLVGCIYIPTMMTAVYNRAKRSPCVMRFNVLAECGWDIGISSGLGVTAFLVWLGVPIAHTILISLVGASVVFVVLRRYYAQHAPERLDAALAEQPQEAAKI
jgi:DHA1 family inner membrane transport protein